MSSTHTIAWAREAVSATAAAGVGRVGAAAVDLEVPLDVAMAGYSSAGKRARGIRGRLAARAFVVEDPAGARAAICVVDMMSASRYLHEAVVLKTSGLGIGAENLLLTGTHTHHGPGHFYGNALYDHFAQCRSGFDRVLADHLATRCARAVIQAIEGFVPGRIGVATGRLWGVGRNAALPAFEKNPESLGWNAGDGPGAKPPEGLSPAQKAVDPRLTAIAAVDEEGALVAALGVFACHNTALGMRPAYYSPDWNGVAVQTAQSSLATRGSADAGPIIALAAGPGGDINTLRSGAHGLTPVVEPGEALRRDVGERVGAVLASAVREAAERASPFDLEVAVTQLDLSEAIVDDDPETELAKEWYFGVPTLGGGEEGRTIFHRLGIAREGRTSRFFPPEHPQHPKARALGPVQRWYQRRLGLATADNLTMHVLRVGTHLFATVPGEPTVVVGHRIERALRAAVEGCTGASVLGYAGGYLGYLTSAEAYSAQFYEGASTLWGRHTARHVQARLVQAASSLGKAGERVALADEVRFIVRTRRVDHPSIGGATQYPAPSMTRAVRAGEVLRLRWFWPRSCSMPPYGSEVRLERVEVGSDSAQAPEATEVLSRMLCDAHSIMRTVPVFGRSARWEAEWDVASLENVVSLDDTVSLQLRWRLGPDQELVCPLENFERPLALRSSA